MSWGAWFVVCGSQGDLCNELQHKGAFCHLLALGRKLCARGGVLLRFGHEGAEFQCISPHQVSS